MKLAYDVYPSHIAKLLAYEVGLLSDMETDFMITESVQSERDKLIEFQQMSLVASFEDCLVAYYENDLSQDQIKKLKIIHEITPKLLPATVFCGAIDAISKERHNKQSNRAVMANLFHTAIDQLLIKQRAAQ